MKYLILLTIILGYCFPQTLFANDLGATSAKVRVHLIEPHAEKKALYLLLVADNICYDIGSKEQQCMPDVNGDYTFEIKNLNQLAAFHLQFDYFRFFSGFIAPGDDVTIIYTKSDNNMKPNMLRFSGKGSYKMDISSRMYFLKSQNGITISESGKYTEKSVDSLLANANFDYLRKKGVIERFRDSLDRKVFNLLDAQLFASTYSSAITYFSYTRRSKISDDNFSFLLDKIKAIKPAFGAEIGCASNDYVGYLVRRSELSANLRNKDPKKRFLNTLNEILREENVLLRERMIMNFIFRGSGYDKSENPELVYADAMKHILNTDYRKLIADLSNARQKGLPAYNFTLEDTNGKKVQLSDFIGKVVVIECWFTGCSSCSLLSKQMEKEVMPNFAQEKDLVFLNVNVDETRTKWMKSLQTGDYSSKGSINLFTQGLGVNHPFILKYQFRGFPQLLLIDRFGKIFSANFKGTGPEMVNTIKAAFAAH
jgi:thiol-disulfide isomerase/thioredoxin